MERLYILRMRLFQDIEYSGGKMEEYLLELAASVIFIFKLELTAVLFSNAR